MSTEKKSLRVIILAIGSAGDVYPFIALAKNLRARGHEVFIAATPFFEEIITANGIAFRALGTVEDFERVKNDRRLWNPALAMPAVMSLAVAPSHEPILAISRELNLPGRSVILASSLAFGARTAGELLDIPVAGAHLAPALFRTLHAQPKLYGMIIGDKAPKWLKALQWWFGGKLVDRYGLPELNRFRAKHDLPPAKNLLADWWHAPAAVFALFPEWFAPAQPDWPAQTRQTGFAMFDGEGKNPWPDGLADFLAEGDPPVVFTPGSAMAQGEKFFREAAKTVEKLGCRALFITAFPDSVPPDLPPRIRHFHYLPFSEILPRAAALVYHGGVGTCARALQAA